LLQVGIRELKNYIFFLQDENLFSLFHIDNGNSNDDEILKTPKIDLTNQEDSESSKKLEIEKKVKLNVVKNEPKSYTKNELINFIANNEVLRVFDFLISQQSKDIDDTVLINLRRNFIENEDEFKKSKIKKKNYKIRKNRISDNLFKLIKE